MITQNQTKAWGLIRDILLFYSRTEKSVGAKDFSVKQFAFTEVKYRVLNTLSVLFNCLVFWQILFELNIHQGSEKIGENT